MSDLKIQGEVSISAESAEASLNRVANAGEKMATGLHSSAQKAGAAVDGIGSGADKSAEQFTRAESRISASIKRATTELELLGKTASQKLEFKISDKGLDASKFEPQLRKLRELESAQLALGASAGKLPTAYDDIARSLGGMAVAAAGFAAAIGGINKLVDTQREFDKINASLVTMTGSVENAKIAFGAIQDFAATTPFSLQEVATAFIRLKSLGLEPSEKALISYGNTASAMGKSLEQFIEAVADASTGEFERLKEFGIKAKKDGDSVSLTFKGISTTIGNSAAEIEQYLQKIGTNDFAGAMSERAKTLDGAISNLSDSWDNLFLTVNQNNTGSLIFDSVKLASGAVDDLSKMFKALASSEEEAARETGALAAIQSGLGTVFETVAILGLNVSYVIKQVGNEIGGIAAQAAALARLDLSGALVIGDMMKQDAAAARKELDATEQRILGTRTAADATRPSLDALKASIAGIVKPAGDAGKAAAKMAEDLRNMRIDELQRMSKEAQKELDAMAKAEAEYYKALGDGSSALEDKARQLEQEVEFYGMTASAIEAVNVARLEEARMIAAANGAYQEHLAFLDREIKARQRIGSASSQKEFLDANKKAAEQSAREWEKFGDDINRSLTDALMRGFESGKSFGENFVDSLKNSLKTAALKIVVNMVTSTGGSLVNDGINFIANTSGSNGGAGTNYLGLANNASSIYNMAGAAYAAYGAISTGAGALPYTASMANAYGAVGGDSLGSFIAMNPQWTAGVAGESAAAGGAGGAAAAEGGASMAGLGYAAGYMAIMYAVFELLTTSKNRYLDTTISGSIGENGFAGTMTDRYKNTGNLINDGSIETNTRLLSGNTAEISEFLKQQAGDVTVETLRMAGYLTPSADRPFDKLEGDYYSPADIDAARKKYLDTVGTGANPWDVRGSQEQVSFATNRDYSRVLSDQAESGGIIKSAIESIYSATKLSLEGVAKQFDDNTVIDKLDNFSKEINVKFGGSIIDGLKVFGDTLAREMGSAWLPSIEGMRKSGEDWASALGRVIFESQAVSGVLDTMGRTLSEVFGKNNADNVLRMSDSFVKLFGSVDVLSQSFDAYYQNFYSDAEKSARAMEALGNQFAAFGIAVPESRDAFRALVEAQDLNTVAGQETFHALMTLQGAFANLVPAIDSVSSSAANAAAILAGQQETQAQRIGAYLDAQRASQLSAQEDILSQQESAAQSSASSATQIADTFRGILNSLTGYRDGLLSGPDSALSAEDQYANARRLYEETAARAKLGDVDAAGKLQSASSAFLEASKSIGTAGSYSKDYGSVMGTLDAVIGVADRQIPIAEQQLTVAQSQLASLESIRASLNATGGSQSASLPLVVENFQQAAKDWANWFDTTEIGSSQTFDVGTTKRLSENIGLLTDLMGNSFTFTKQEGFYGLADKSTAWAEEMKRRYGSLMSFDVGSNYVPTDMTANIHRGERIFTAVDNQRIVSAMEGQSGLVEELRALREEVVMLRAETRATATHTASMSNAINRVMPDGDALAMRIAA